MPGVLTAEELAAAKRYMRVDLDLTDEDQVVEACVFAARAYMTDAGVKIPDAGTARRYLYDVVVHSLALTLFDHRDASLAGAVNDNPVLRRCITQLKLTAVSKSDTAEEE